MENNIINKIKPDISIVASAHRPQNWMNLYNSIGDNHVDFELVFVGPNPPDYDLPKNFRFIRSLVKPAQCLEIAYRNSLADLVMNIADDCVFKISGPLDRLYETYKSYNNGKIILSCRYMMDGQDLSYCAHRFFIDESSDLIMPVCGLMSKKFFSDIGGIDKNFIAVMWDLDIAMRVYTAGGRVVLSDVYINEDKGKSAGSNSCCESAVHDRPLLESLWMTNGKIHLNRKKPVDPFLDINILNASQGPRGRWRGNGPLLLEKIEDNFLIRWSIPGRIMRAIAKPSMYLNCAKRIFSRLKGN